MVERGEVKSVRFVEPLVKPEDFAEEEEEEPAATDSPEVENEAAQEDPATGDAPSAPDTKDIRGKEIRIPETAEEPIELIFEEPTLF